MTREEFLARLRQTPRDWYLEPDGEIRRRIGHIPQCPISSLEDRPAHEFEEVADNLEIYSCLAIARAADNMRKCSNKIRAQLLEACGLTEKP